MLGEWVFESDSVLKHDIWFVYDQWNRFTSSIPCKVSVCVRKYIVSTNGIQCLMFGIIVMYKTLYKKQNTKRNKSLKKPSLL